MSKKEIKTGQILHYTLGFKEGDLIYVTCVNGGGSVEGVSLMYDKGEVVTIDDIDVLSHPKGLMSYGRSIAEKLNLI